ncbi:uncharacterized protein LOC129305108 isoform X1 [Prosopis cineraria]|uniref:uncharacterized protein LOC129305108 isoform X1 n=1 Tax=Prosopis cineraria TaxID=364024 RepID=UPI00240EAD01|nr:uncharacterized protein LOC129305108 isoform X1 [Prosopis cineraria]
MEVGPVPNNEEMSPAGEEAIQESGSVVFLLNNLPFDADDDAPGAQPNLPYRIENLAATYISPLEQILSSKLHSAGCVRAVFVNFGPKGYHEIKPNWSPVTRPAEFEALLRELFQNGMKRDPVTNEVLWHKITDLSSLLANLPANSRKIGCLHGATSQGSASINFQDYIKNASLMHSFVFVVGQIANEEIEGFLDEFVKVSEYELVPTYCLSRVIKAMEDKWNI